MFTSLKARLLALCTVCIVLALAGLATANYLTASLFNSETLAVRLESASSSNSGAFATWVRSKRLVVHSVARAIDSADPRPVLQSAAIAGNFANVFVGYADKHYVYADPKGIPADFDPTSRPWYKLAVAEGKPGLTQPFTSTASGKTVITFTEPVGPAGTPAAVIGANIDIAFIAGMTREIKPTPHSYALLFSENGTVLGHPDQKMELKAANDVHAELTAEKVKELHTSNANWETTIAGREVYVRVSQIKDSTLYLAIIFDKEDATEGLAAMLKSSVVAAAIALALCFAALAAVVTRALRRLDKVRDAMQEVASGEGDLTLRIDDAGKDELAAIARAYNLFAEKMASILLGIRASSDAVKTGAAEIATGNLDLSSRTEQQASSLEETASAMEELTSTVQQNADSSKQANQLAVSASSFAEKGGVLMGQVVETIGKVDESAHKISDITSVIDGIAFQTNILALNAAVEAARAGDAGRGFAVVATEVRNLAHRSAAAAKEIKGLIQESNEQVRQSVQLVETAGMTMSEIVDGIKRVTDITSEITAASQEQSAGIGQVNKAISEMDAVTQQNAALVEEAAAAAQSLQQQADELAEAVGQFKLEK